MKNYFKLSLFLILIFFSCTEKDIKSETLIKNNIKSQKKIIIKNNTVIVCIGDSITAGEASVTNWPAELKKILISKKYNFNVHNEGESGLSTSEFLSDSKYEFRKKSALKKYSNIHYVFLLLGHNDTRGNSSEGRNRNNFSSVKKYYSNMQKIIKFLVHRKNRDGRKVKVILITPPPVREPVLKNPWKFPHNFNFIMQKKNGYLSNLKKLSIKFKLPVIDTHKTFYGGKSIFPPYIKAKKEYIAYDGIHLSAKGQKALAHLVYKSILIQN